jgi:hypothetical protein
MFPHWSHRGCATFASMVKSSLRLWLLAAGLSLLLGACANTQPANSSSSTLGTTPSGGSSPASSQTDSLRPILSKAVAATTMSTAHFETTITLLDDRANVMTVSSSYNWDTASGDSTINLPGGAISTAWTSFIGDRAYAKGMGDTGSSWVEMQRSTTVAHYLARTPLNDPSLLVKWLEGAQVVSGDAQSMVLLISVPAAVQYLEPSRGEQSAELLQGLGNGGMEAIVTFDDAGHINSLTFNVRKADQTLYVSSVTKLSNFGETVVESAPSSPLPASGVGGILLG